MKKYFSIWMIFVLTLCLFTGCGENKITDNSENDDRNISSVNDNYSESSKDEEDTSDTIGVDFSQLDINMFTERDMKTEYDASKVMSYQVLHMDNSYAWDLKHNGQYNNRDSSDIYR